MLETWIIECSLSWSASPITVHGLVVCDGKQPPSTLGKHNVADDVFCHTLVTLVIHYVHL